MELKDRNYLEKRLTEIRAKIQRLGAFGRDYDLYVSELLLLGKYARETAEELTRRKLQIQIGE